VFTNRKDQRKKPRGEKPAGRSKPEEKKHRRQEIERRRRDGPNPEVACRWCYRSFSLQVKAKKRGPKGKERGTQ